MVVEWLGLVKCADSHLASPIDRVHILRWGVVGIWLECWWGGKGLWEAAARDGTRDGIW